MNVHPKNFDADQQMSSVALPGAGLITALPFRFPDPASIPPGEWLYGRHAIRKFVSVTVAAGGVGKSSLAIAGQLALASGKDLLGDRVKTPARTWYIGVEDPYVEYERRLARGIKHFHLAEKDFAGGIFLNSGRDQDYVIAQERHGEVLIAIPKVEAIIGQIQKNGIALVTVGPFVASHTVRENDNGSIEQVARAWAYMRWVLNGAVCVVKERDAERKLKEFLVPGND